MIYEEYLKGKKFLEEIDLYQKVERSYRFYEGDQWYDLKIKENMPQPQVYNFINGIVDMKVASVCVNRMTASYTDQASVNQDTCDKVNDFFKQKWETMKLDTAMWSDCWNSTIAGEAYRYFYNGGNSSMEIDSVNIMFADEKETDIQEQPYILIVQRLEVDKVKEEARSNGISEDDIVNITPDSADNELGDEREIKDQKVTSILKLWKKDGKVYYKKATKGCEYLPEQTNGMTLYPIARLVLYPKKWSARGIGIVRGLIDNQIAYNKLMVNRNTTANVSAFPKTAYLSGKIQNPQDINKIGVALAMNGDSVQDINKIITYLQPASSSPDATRLANEMLTLTKELANAGKALMGDINPEQASGAAIVAARDQAMLPASRQIQIYQQYIEDIARILLNMWQTFNPNGLFFVADGEEVKIDNFSELNLNIKVDVYSDSPMSRMAREQNIINLMSSGKIELEDFVELLDKNSNFDKQGLREIVERRKNELSKMPVGVENNIQQLQDSQQPFDIGAGIGM